MMTQTRHAIDHRPKRRSAEERQYLVYYAIGFVLFLPFVVATRLLPRSAHRANSSQLGDRVSILDQTRAEVSNVLAFVFMA